MSSPLLPPPVLVADDESLAQLVRVLASHPIVAVDTESNSLHAYRERVCLIQFSTPDADYIVFCGVHFMAESADILGRESQRVILPDLGAGCSMADMATIEQVHRLSPARLWPASTGFGLPVPM